MFRPSIVVLAILLVPFGASSATAGDFTFDVPELAGLYTGEEANRNVDLSLGMSFAEIEGVSLRLVGTHTLGAIQLLYDGAPIEPYPAEVIGLFPEAGPSFTTAFDEILPAVGGPFDFTFAFDNLRYPPGEPNFDPLLDGEARLDVSAGGPPIIAIYAILSNPVIDVSSATLIVSGQPELDTFMLSGDYDRNGSVDDADFAVWRATWGSSSDLRADGNGDGMVDAADYSVWRQNLGTSHAAGTVSSVPEAAAGWLLATGAMLLAFLRGNFVRQ